MKSTQLLLLLISFLFVSCEYHGAGSGSKKKPNIILLIADDMGLDATPGYAIGNIKPKMPNLEKLMNRGVRFTNTWSNPVCTPTRSTIITGKYGIRTGVLNVRDQLPPTEKSIQQYLAEKSTGYQSAIIGKWHLGRGNSNPDNFGLDYYAGILSGGVRDYYNWSLFENGAETQRTEYATTKLTDLAIDWVKNQEDPWFLWLAYNAPHRPFHLPPSDLHSQGDLPDNPAAINANPQPYYLAAIEAMDTEIGRLLGSLSPEELKNTVIIFVGDNGSPRRVAQGYPNIRAKGTMYQGGINVPMIVSGKNVPRFGETETALISTTDLFATIAEIAGVDSNEIHDSKSFLSLLNFKDTANRREYAYSERRITRGNGNTNDQYAIRNQSHKYIVWLYTI